MTLQVASLIRRSSRKQHGTENNRSYLSTCSQVIRPWHLKVQHGKPRHTFKKLDVTESDLKPDIDFFQAPIVNSTIKDKISDPGVLRGDSFIFKFQSQLISGANGILNLWQHIKDCKDLSHADVLKTLQKSLVLIGSSFAGLSSFRRYRFKSSLNPEFQSLVKEPEGGFSPSKFLFGDDLSSKIKNLFEENKLIRKIAKNCNRFSNRRVVFKQVNFRKQKQDASRIKTETTQF